MSKIATYPSADTPLQLSDRLIGTEAPRLIPSPTPLATKNFSLGELLQLFSSNFPAASLQEVLNTGNTATQNITLTGTITSTVIKPTNIEDTSGSQGTTFQYLSKGASSINWVDLPIDNLQAVLNAGNTATQNITLFGNITSTKIIPGNIQDDTAGIGSVGQVLSKTASGIRWITNPASFTAGLADVLSVGNTATNNITLIGDIKVSNARITAAIYDSTNSPGVSGQFLSSKGTGMIWADVPLPIPAALTKVNDTNVTLTLGGSPSTALLQGVSLTLGWTGTLADGRIASASNWNTAYTNRITSLTTTGSGAATLISNVLNIPISSTGTVTSVAALTLGTSGTDLSSSVATGTTTPVITLNVPTASATNRGALSSADWTTFNGKFNLPSLTSGSVLFSNGTTIAQDNANFFWDNTNKRLGIGTVTPAVKLDARGGFNLYSDTGFHYLEATSTSSTDGTLNFRRNGGGNGIYRFQLAGLQLSNDYNTGEARFFIPSGGFFSTFYSNGVERMRMTTTGNTLINTTTDNGGKLQIKAPGALSTDIALRVRNSADTADLLQINGAGTFSVKGSQQRISFAYNDYVYIGLAVNNNAIGVNSSNRLFIGSEGDFPIYTLANGTVIITDTTNPTSSVSAKLRIDSTTQGFLPPRMTTTQKNAITTPALGLVVFDTTINKLCVFGATTWETITSI